MEIISVHENAFRTTSALTTCNMLNLQGPLPVVNHTQRTPLNFIEREL